MKAGQCAERLVWCAKQIAPYPELPESGCFAPLGGFTIAHDEFQIRFGWSNSYKLRSRGFAFLGRPFYGRLTAPLEVGQPVSTGFLSPTPRGNP